MVYPVIMAGGIGSRFWPASTPELPKQFLPLIDEKKSMMQMTVDRFASGFKKENIWIVSHEKYKKLLKKHAKGVLSKHLLLEPMMRNTAPCIGWGAKTLLARDPNAIMIIATADHWIAPTSAFIRDVKKAVSFVKKNPTALVTFGIKPDYPETGYGYIEHGKTAGKAFYQVKQFIEKPNINAAKRMVRKKRYLWNSGMFVWRADTILKEIERHLPEHYKQIQLLTRSNLKRNYRKFAPISIDYGVMEKSKNVYVVRASFEWSDVGSWESVGRFKKNISKNWTSLDSKNCFVDGNGRRIATIGVQDLIIIDKPDGLLICHKDHAQRVRELSKK